MLKKLLAGMLVVLFVVGVCGTANAFLGGLLSCLFDDCDLEFDIEYELDVDLNEYWLEMVGDNIASVCQDGNANVVASVDQLNGSNLLLGAQDGGGNIVSGITQHNTTPEEGMNVLTIRQEGNANVVTDIFQYNTY